MAVAAGDGAESRIDARFPGSGLGRVCCELAQAAARARERAAWIARPIIPLRIAAALLSVLIIVGLIGAASRLRVAGEPFSLLDFAQLLESGINDLVLTGAAIWFLLSLETRIKRHRALAARIEAGSCQPALAVVEEYLQCAGLAVGRGQVGPAVPVEVVHDRRGQIQPGEAESRLRRPARRAVEEQQPVRPAGRDRQVGHAVPVEVAAGQPAGPRAHRRVARDPETGGGTPIPRTDGDPAA